jgi:hypothetical protein
MPGSALPRRIDFAVSGCGLSSTDVLSPGPARVRLRRAALLVIACAFGLLLSVFSATASAAITHKPESFSPLTGSGSGVTIHEPSGVAIDEATGNVFLTDGSGGEAVVVLGGTGAAPAELASPFSITGLSFGGSVAGIAYDNAAGSSARGTLYVFQSGVIKKFTRNSGTGHYEAAGEIPATGTGGPAAGMTVDEAGNVYLGDFTSQTVTEWSPTGVQLHKYNFASSPTNRPSGLAVDSAGNLFVQRQGGGGVYKYPFGLGEVEVSNPTVVTTAGASGVAYDPASNHVYVALNTKVVEYDATSLATISEFGEGALTQTERLAIDSATGRIYVADKGAGKKNLAVFSPPVTVPTPGVGAATNVTGTKATLNGSVNPEGIEVEECFFEYGETISYGDTAPCEGTIGEDSEPRPVSANISGLTANGTTYHFRLVARNENGTEQSADKTLATANTVATEPATDIGVEAATLIGTLRPEGLQYTSCVFEYGLTTSAGFEEAADCNPPAASVEPDFAAHPVSLAPTDLQPNATYKFRLTATNANGTLNGEILTFTTQGPPQITEVRASAADQDSATLEAKIDPSGSGTSYRFEWGTTAAYGHSVPAEFEPFIGTGEMPVAVRANLTGLSADTAYHYRVVARSEAGATPSPDHQVETLNACGLPEDRCFELVSPSNVGPAASPGEPANGELGPQPAAAGNSLAYPIENGLPGTTKGAFVLYQATRGASGWTSEQIAPPIVARNETSGSNSAPSLTLAMSSDLSCGVVESNQPIANDAAMELVREAGGSNLYRREAGGAITPITDLAPTNPGAAGENNRAFKLAGVSDDCRTLAFTTPYDYPGLGAETNNALAQSRMYEWRGGRLRSVGVIPGASGDTQVGAGPGDGREDFSNVVADDGSRIIFSALRVVPGTPGNPEEEGKFGIFVREGGAVTRDVSASETATPDLGAEYFSATADGSRVFFRANYGLTESTSTGERTGLCGEGEVLAGEPPCDLYEYDLEKAPSDHPLTDLSVDSDPGGAHVTGFVGASADGSHVYFLAQGQLQPGKGKTLAENQEDHTYSLYSKEAGSQPRFVGTVSAHDAERGVAVRRTAFLTSRVSASGRFLLFESSENVTGYESGADKGRQTYLYDAEAGSEPVVCVSCRQNGEESANVEGEVLLSIGSADNVLFEPRTLVVRDGQPLVFFRSWDPLTGEGPEGEIRLYEWAHDQVFLLAGPTLGSPHFMGAASEDGGDVYFGTTDSLTWRDGDQRSSVYDARIGGGFPGPPPPGPPPCAAAAEGSCQGDASSPVGTPGAGTASFSGPGNVHHKKKHKKPHHKKPHHKKKHHKRKHRKGKNQHGKHRNRDGRVGK